MICSRKFTIAAGIFGALCFPYEAGAQGGFNGPGSYQIANLNSGKVLDLDRNDQTSVIQFSARGTDNQEWEIREVGAGYYFLRNTMNGNVLEAIGNGNSSRVRAARYVGGSGQQWRFDASRDGHALIVSRLGRTLDIADGSTRDGAPVQIYDSNGESNQQFTFRQVTGNRAGGSNGNTNRDIATRNDVSPGAATNRTQLRPGWNMFSPQQDIEVGQQAAGELAQQVPLMNDPRVDNYLNNLGQRLSAHAPGYKFPYTYKAVNDRAINAFALPGGHIYINRGVIEAADNEAQLAGVMAHETSHVALRHGTNQASKASAAQLPLSILGGLLGGNSSAAALAQLGSGFTVNSILLKYSRMDESQADIMGTHILADSGYDPRAMGQFFEKIQAQDKGGNRIAFFNDHPSPDRRIESVNEEVARLGGGQRGYNSGSGEFDQIKRYVQSMSAQGSNQSRQPQGETRRNDGGGRGRPSGNSERFVAFENSVLRIDHPDNWQTNGQGDAVTFTPRGGMVNDGSGNQALAYGVLINIYEPHANHFGQQLQSGGFGRQNSAMPGEAATDDLVATLRQSNRNMRVIRSHEGVDVNGERGLSTYLSNDSAIPGGGRETNWLVTLPRADGLLFIVFTAPEREFQGYERTFQQMLYSVRMKQ
jgi:hypothetical protein